jgi:DNA-binding NarL/FixJ family response regulator
MAGKAQDQKTVMISTCDAALGEHYCSILNEFYPVTVIATLGETLLQTRENRPALLVLDPRLAEQDLNDVVADILSKNTGIRLIVIEGSADGDIDQHALFKTGVHGFCKQDISAVLLCKAIQLVLEGEYWIQRKLITQVISELAKDAGTIVSGPDGPDDSLINTLTPRELQVAHMVHMGGNNKMIARELDISERTVKAHLSAIFRKLDIENRLHLALYFSGRT